MQKKYSESLCAQKVAVQISIAKIFTKSFRSNGTASPADWMRSTTEGILTAATVQWFLKE